jgi:hypothetical protein
MVGGVLTCSWEFVVVAGTSTVASTSGAKFLPTNGTSGLLISTLADSTGLYGAQWVSALYLFCISSVSIEPLVSPTRGHKRSHSLAIAGGGASVPSISLSVGQTVVGFSVLAEHGKSFTIDNSSAQSSSSVGLQVCVCVCACTARDLCDELTCFPVLSCGKENE